MIRQNSFVTEEDYQYLQSLPLKSVNHIKPFVRIKSFSSPLDFSNSFAKRSLATAYRVRDLPQDQSNLYLQENHQQ